MISYCKKCWTPSTRPRITFNEEGICNACQWGEAKKSVNWRGRQHQFQKICDFHVFRQVLVPWSGGKDSIYVAYKMRELGLNPTLITVIPHMETEVGKWNRQNMCKDFEKIEIILKPDKYADLAKKYFIEQGRPKHPWETAISAAVINWAYNNGYRLIVYGEEGEAEYGGVSHELQNWAEKVNKKYLMKYYWQGHLDWEIPDDMDNIFFTQWSRFENWSPDKHAHFAVAKGMRTEPIRNMGTFSSTAQLSDRMQDLHTYLMFLKFGFGRCTSDVSIGIREGWITREQGLDWIKAYDGEFLPRSETNRPTYYKDEESYIGEFLNYFKMSREEFSQVLAKHVNKELLVQKNDIMWVLKPEVEEIRNASR